MKPRENPSIDDLSKHRVRELFEGEYFEVDLETQIRQCDTFELIPVFMRYLPGNEPLLEAGCGSGRWVAWFIRKGYRAVGLDWSEALCAAAREAIPGGRFEAGDMRDMPFGQNEFGSVIALGSLEHVQEGPEPALREFRRILRDKGLAIITVPYAGRLRRLLLAARSLRASLKPPAHLKQKLQRDEPSDPTSCEVPTSPIGGLSGVRSLREARAGTRREWNPSFMYNASGWHFYQYHFSKTQMRDFLRRTEFEILEEWIAFHDAGILMNFGHIAGGFDKQIGEVLLSPAGRLLRALIPRRYVGHMLCYVARRS